MTIKSKFLEVILSGTMLLSLNSDIYAGTRSKSFPMDLAKAECTSINPKYPTKLNVDLRFDKAKSDYYSHSLEVILSTEDYQKNKEFFDYVTIGKAKSSMYLVHDPTLEMGKVTEEIYVSEMKNEKITGRWRSINSTNETNSKTIKRSQKYFHEILKLLGRVTIIEDILENTTDFLEYFENKGINEALDNMSEKYIVDEIPFHSPRLKGNTTAWKFNINLKKSGKSYIGIIPVVYLKKGLIQNEIEGRFEGALISVPQDETKKIKPVVIKEIYRFPREQISNEQNDQRKIEMAILYYHSIKEGSYPKSLNELVPDFFDSLPMGNWEYDSKTGKIQKK